MSSYLKQILLSMRPRQWVKNFMVFPALIFSVQVFELHSLFLSLWAFLVFCLLSGSVYLFNDLADVESDRRHPVKCKRPIPSGALPIEVARRASRVLLIAALLGAAAIIPVSGLRFLLVCLAYLVLQVFYSTKLKHVVILDVMCIALGFDLRVLAGGVALNVPVSFWLITCTSLLALFLGFGKRRHELTLLADEATSHRRILQEYSVNFLDQMISVVTASTVLAYSLYTLSEETVAAFGGRAEYLPLTIPFVLYGIFRYLYLVHQKDSGGSPTRTLLTDPPILVNIGLWLAAVVIILY